MGRICREGEHTKSGGEAGGHAWAFRNFDQRNGENAECAKHHLV
jgi:hypothetical protein